MSNIAKWLEMSTKLKQLRIDEMELRKEICDELSTGHEMVNGRLTAKHVIDNFNVKAVLALGYKIDPVILHSIWGELSPDEKDVVKFEPVLKVGPYKKLAEDCDIHEAITSRIAAPTLEAIPIVER